MSDEPVSPDASGSVSCPHCGTAHPIAWAHCPTTGLSLGTGKALVGRMIAGRYRVVGILAEGGMGTVYAAEHAVNGRRVAIKRLHPELAREGTNVERFQREARAAGAIGHENIIQIIDLGFAEDGAPYLAMEYLTGETLATSLRREGRFAPARACYV
ncbi:MAG: protein kinase, partial [Polyangiaceae bacterium]|nr:protein kinase [Polyangiaceae bacterium]